MAQNWRSHSIATHVFPAFSILLLLPVCRLPAVGISLLPQQVLQPRVLPLQLRNAGIQFGQLLPGFHSFLKMYRFILNDSDGKKRLETDNAVILLVLAVGLHPLLRFVRPSQGSNRFAANCKNIIKFFLNKIQNKKELRPLNCDRVFGIVGGCGIDNGLTKMGNILKNFDVRENETKKVSGDWLIAGFITICDFAQVCPNK
jgi:hypothetical protein